MKNFDTICYRKNFIDEAIIRVDFSDYISTENIFNDKVLKVVSNKYQRAGKAQVVNFGNISVHIGKLKPEDNPKSEQSVEQSIKEGRQQEYYGIDNRNKVILSNKFIILSIKDYISFEDFIDNFNSILVAIYSNVEYSVARAGIRYVNIFDKNKIKIRKNYFIKDISNTIDANWYKNNDDIACIRSITLTEFIENSMILNFRYGLYNPEYPNKIKINNFTLDFDCYCTCLISKPDELVDFFNKAHLSIQNLFELSITDNLRKVMNDE
jgi:uncharacterized protein (TIGR04255 family)